MARLTKEQHEKVNQFLQEKGLFQIINKQLKANGLGDFKAVMVRIEPKPKPIKVKVPEAKVFTIEAAGAPQDFDDEDIDGKPNCTPPSVAVQQCNMGGTCTWVCI